MFDYSDIIVGPGNTAVLERGIAEVAAKYQMEWKVGGWLCVWWWGVGGVGWSGVRMCVRV